MCCTWSGALKMLPRCPKIMQIFWGYQKKCLLFIKSAILSEGENFIFEGGGVGRNPPLKKVLILVQRPQHKSTSDSFGAPQKNHFGAILIEFGDTKKCHTFWGLELVPIS